MLVAPRISQGLGLPWSAFVCYSLPWSARVCLGCCCWHRMALNAWTYKWDGMEISVCVSSNSTALRCSRPNLSYVLIVIIAFQLSGIGQAIKMDNLQQYVTLSCVGASVIFGHIRSPLFAPERRRANLRDTAWPSSPSPAAAASSWWQSWSRAWTRRGSYNQILS